MMRATLSGRSPWIRFASAWRAWSEILGAAFLAFVLSLILAGAAHSAQTARQSLDGWIENGTQATIDQVSAAAAQRFKPVLPDAVHDLGPGKTLWLRLRLQADPGARPEWGLDLPVPLLDFVTLYEKGPDGKWSAQRAGDTLAVASWSRPGRYASFDLNLPPGATREVFLQVRHRDPIGFELRIAPASALEQGRKIDYLPLGMILGTLLLLTAWCLIQAGIHRDPVYAWYGLYAAAMTLTMAAVTGVAGQLFWNQSPFWADRAQGVLPIALSGINILFLRHLCSLAARYPKVDRLALGTGVLVLLMSAAYPWVEGWASNAMVSFSLLASLVLTFVLAGLAWRRGDPVGGWVLLAYAPLALTIVVVVVRLYGWITASWLTFDASAAASALAVPLLLGALHARSRDRHGVRTRVNKLTQQDALTGLLSAMAFEEQLKGAVSGAIMRREAAAVVVVEVVNLQAIRQAYGDEMAEQCLLRAVIKLHRVVRDSDPAGRIAPGRFGLVLEGVRSRAELQERMVRLLTAGLTPARGAALDIPLQFHLACVLLSERVMTPALLLRDLDRLLAVAVASPCTAPFMGASLGLAVSLPAAQALAVFAITGLGLALPYLAASLVPAVARALPRPGAWMQTFRRLMAFPMFATVVWLVWVLGQQTGIDGAGALLTLLVSGAFVVWALTLNARARLVFATLSIAGFALLTLGIGQNIVKFADSTPVSGSAERWQPWATGKVDSLLAAGQPVFVDFTAAWCVTCQYNKKTTLANAAVLADFDAKKVHLLRADWTRRDPAITAALSALGRNGVPVYVLYQKGRAPVVLSEILGVDEVRSALAAL